MEKKKIWNILQEKKIPTRKREESIIFLSPDEDVIGFISFYPYPYVRVSKKYHVPYHSTEGLKIKVIN